MAGIDQYTVLMLHGDSPVWTTVVPDSSPSNHTVTNHPDPTTEHNYAGIQPAPAGHFNNGCVTVDPDDPMFNPVVSWLSIDDSDDWDFGTGDFTIDFWLLNVAPASLSNHEPDYAGIISAKLSTTQAWQLYFGGVGQGLQDKLLFYPGSGASSLTSTSVMSAGSMKHIAIVRSGNGLVMYVNGASEGTLDVTGMTINSLGNGIVLGRLTTDASNYYSYVWLDELRISKGIARWTSNFTPATEPYSYKVGSHTVIGSGTVGASGTKDVARVLEVSATGIVSGARIRETASGESVDGTGTVESFATKELVGLQDVSGTGEITVELTKSVNSGLEIEATASISGAYDYQGAREVQAVGTGIVTASFTRDGKVILPTPAFHGSASVIATVKKEINKARIISGIAEFFATAQVIPAPLGGSPAYAIAEGSGSFTGPSEWAG